jgi:carboxypeptidase C (cathepsin A)
MTRVAALCVCFLVVSAAVPGAQPTESYSTTSHVVRIDGRDVKYTAVAGTLPVKDAAGRVTELKRLKENVARFIRSSVAAGRSTSTQ